MKILLLNQTFVPDVASSGQHLADLAIELVERGHEVTVVTSCRAYSDTRKRFAAKEIWRGVRIVRVGCLGFGQGRLWHRLLDAVSFIASACIRMLFLPRPDVLVALTSPPLIAVVALMVARLRRTRFTYWVMDLNPDEAFAVGCLNPESLVGITLEWLSRMSLRQADRVIALDRFMAKRMRDKGVSPSRIAVVPPWSHDSEVRFDLQGRERFRARHGLQGKLVVMYSGNHSLCHPLTTVLEAARILQTNRDIVFCFIGGGAQFRGIEQAAQRAKHERGGGPRIICLPYQPLAHLSASLSAADLHLVVMGDPFVGIVHPCKIYNLLRLPTPIIFVGPKPSPVSEILEERPGPARSACVSHRDPEALAGHIHSFLMDAGEVGEQPCEAASRFSRERMVPRLIAELEGQGGGRGAMSEVMYLNKIDLR